MDSVQALTESLPMPPFLRGCCFRGLSKPRTGRNAWAEYRFLTKAAHLYGADDAPMFGHVCSARKEGGWSRLTERFADRRRRLRDAYVGTLSRAREQQLVRPRPHWSAGLPPSTAQTKRPGRSPRPSVCVVEVRRVELLSTTAHSEVSPSSVASRLRVRSVKRQTSRSLAGSVLARSIPTTSAGAIP